MARKNSKIELSEFRVHLDPASGAKVVWRDADGKKYGMRMSHEDYTSLNVEELEVIKKVTF